MALCRLRCPFLRTNLKRHSGDYVHLYLSYSVSLSHKGATFLGVSNGQDCQSLIRLTLKMGLHLLLRNLSVSVHDADENCQFNNNISPRKMNTHFLCCHYRTPRSYRYDIFNKLIIVTMALNCLNGKMKLKQIY